MVKEYRRSIEKKLDAKESLDKSLVFFRIMNILNDNSMTKEMLLSALEYHSEECVYTNLIYMEKSGLIEKSGEGFAMPPKTKKLLLKAK